MSWLKKQIDIAAKFGGARGGYQVSKIEGNSKLLNNLSFFFFSIFFRRSNEDLKLKNSIDYLVLLLMYLPSNQFKKFNQFYLIISLIKK